MSLIKSRESDKRITKTHNLLTDTVDKIEKIKTKLELTQKNITKSSIIDEAVDRYFGELGLGGE